MLQIIHFVCLSYLLMASDVVRSKPDYLYSDEAGGWLKVHLMPATWEEALIRCHYEGVPLSDMEIEWSSLHTGTNTGDCLTMSVNGDLNDVYTSSCMDPLPFICYRKFDNQTINECGTFDNEYQFRRCSGSCYKVHQKIQTWTRAYGICSSEGGHLVILNDAEEAHIVKDMFPAFNMGELWDSFHVGLRAWSKSIWTTIHGESFEHVFNKWNDGQPNNLMGIQDRAVFARQGALEDIEPNFKAMFVCEKSPTSIQYEAVPL